MSGFVLGKPDPKRSSQYHPPGRAVMWVLLLCILLIVILAVGVVLYVPPAVSGPDTAAVSINLLESPAPGKADTLPLCPPWLVMLVAGFAVLQVMPVLAAYWRARQGMLSARAVRKISFLVETPMYLGLMGSLLGVCLTQFISGSLAAPLAYLTTITGIVLYLFGKFTIWLSLPDEALSND